MARGKNKQNKKTAGLYTCGFCDCPPIANNKHHIARHNNGSKHRKMENLLAKRGSLSKWAIQYVENTHSYVCDICNETMKPSLSMMESHYTTQHQLPAVAKIPEIEVSKVYKTKTFYEKQYNFMADMPNFQVIHGPVIMTECFGRIGIFLLEVIPKDNISRFYAMASLLEHRGNEKLRGKKIGGSRMVMFGMYENHTCG